MGFTCGIIGLPNVGKSTLFNALTIAGVPAENYPFCTVEPNHGIVAVPDDRLAQVAAPFHPDKITPTTMEFVDIAGLVKGASSGEGLGNQFLAHIQEVDAVAQVVRCFADDNVIHVHGKVDPIQDLSVIEIELILRDLEMVNRRLDKQRKMLRVGDKEAKAEIDVLEAVEQALAKGLPASLLKLDEEKLALIHQTPLITQKPMLLVANISDSQISASNDATLGTLRRHASDHQLPLVEISARTESELNDLSPEDRQAFMAELKLTERGLPRFIKAGYDLLHLITFFTTVGTEVRAWTIKLGTPAAKAAGKIHTDFEKGFIRAEVIASTDLIRLGSEAAVREKGLLRSEGRDYVVQDGDVIRFRFNV